MRHRRGTGIEVRIASVACRDGMRANSENRQSERRLTIGQIRGAKACGAVAEGDSAGGRACARSHGANSRGEGQRLIEVRGVGRRTQRNRRRGFVQRETGGAGVLAKATVARIGCHDRMQTRCERGDGERRLPIDKAGAAETGESIEERHRASWRSGAGSGCADRGSGDYRLAKDAGIRRDVYRDRRHVEIHNLRERRRSVRVEIAVAGIRRGDGVCAHGERGSRERRRTR